MGSGRLDRRGIWSACNRGKEREVGHYKKWDGKHKAKSSEEAEEKWSTNN